MQQFSHACNVAPVLLKKDARVNWLGTAVIPNGTVEISERAFEGCAALRHVSLPPSIRKIGTGAFADCCNLTSVELNEGLEELGIRVFGGCNRLTRLKLPNSLKDVMPRTFRDMSLREPLYSQDGAILYRYQTTVQRKCFTVPAGVKRLASGAFSRECKLEEIHLPEGLEEIDRMAFDEIPLREITIPSTVRKVRGNAFWNCRDLARLEIQCDRSAFSPGILHRCGRVQIMEHGQKADFELELHLRGIDIVGTPKDLKAPETNLWGDATFSALAERSCRGDAEAMLALADYLEAQGTAQFYACAANFWRVRAMQYGSTAAADWKTRWFREHPRTLIPSLIGTATYGEIPGSLLYAAGFRFFDPERAYFLGGVDKDGIVEVRSWCGEDGPDEDGYGREELYDWWFLNEHLQEIPGVTMIHSCSSRDRYTFPQPFNTQHQAAVEALRNPDHAG